MALNKVKLGSCILLNNEINTNLDYDASCVVGVNLDKRIIPTKADTSNADISKYYIVNPEDFIYNPRTHGKRIGLGFNDKGVTVITSWNNSCFKIKDTSTLLPEYLYMNFCRDEWDREACFQSWGSSTVVFTWDSLCNMKMYLPPIDIQQKYVNIYKAMVANLKAYERGLEDLEITFNSLLDKYKHSSPRVKMREVFEEIDNRNTDGNITDVQGINKSKSFMPTVADVSESSLEKYKVIKNGQFAFSGMQTGRDRCIRISLYKNEKPTLISPAYSVFKIKSNLIIPAFVMMWFLRPQVDRLGWFISDSSIRSNLDLDRFYDMTIPVPTFEEQQSIVKVYKAYTMRKNIVEKMRENIKSICPVLIQGAIREAMRR